MSNDPLDFLEQAGIDALSANVMPTSTVDSFSTLDAPASPRTCVSPEPDTPMPTELSLDGFGSQALQSFRPEPLHGRGDLEKPSLRLVDAGHLAGLSMDELGIAPSLRRSPPKSRSYSSQPSQAHISPSPLDQSRVPFVRSSSPLQDPGRLINAFHPVKQLANSAGASRNAQNSRRNDKAKSPPSRDLSPLRSFPADQPKPPRQPRTRFSKNRSKLPTPRQDREEDLESATTQQREPDNQLDPLPIMPALITPPPSPSPSSAPPWYGNEPQVFPLPQPSPLLPLESQFQFATRRHPVQRTPRELIPPSQPFTAPADCKQIPISARVGNAVQIAEFSINQQNQPVGLVLAQPDLNPSPNLDRDPGTLTYRTVTHCTSPDCLNYLGPLLIPSLTPGRRSTHLVFPCNVLHLKGAPKRGEIRQLRLLQTSEPALSILWLVDLRSSRHTSLRPKKQKAAPPAFPSPAHPSLTSAGRLSS